MESGADPMAEDEAESAGLLQQLGSLQTLDKDDLVSQMLRLIDGPSSLTAETAKFYLEMNQWNVQSAVCSYFDLSSGPAAPAMTFVKDVTIGEGESVPPDTPFLKTWTVQNTGMERWPDHCVLRFTHGLQMAGVDRVAVQALARDQCADVSVEMRSPAQPGIYESKWRMSTSTGLYFGDTIWVIITVERAGTMALTQQMNNFSALGGHEDCGGGGEVKNPFAPHAIPSAHPPPQPDEDDAMNDGDAC